MLLTSLRVGRPGFVPGYLLELGARIVECSVVTRASSFKGFDYIRLDGVRQCRWLG